MQIENSPLNKSVSRFLKYAKGLDETKFKINGFPVGPSGVESIFDHILSNFADLITKLNSHIPDKKLQIYSLQNPYLELKKEKETPREFWNSETIKVLFDNTNGKKGITDIFIFLFDSGENDLSMSNNFFKKKNSTDDQFCHSSLFRDFVKKTEIGFEIDLAIKKTLVKTAFGDYLCKKTAQLNFQNSGNNDYDFNVIQEKIVNSFLSYFQSINCDKETFVKQYKKYLTDFYAYQVNSKSFKDIDKNEIIVDDIKMSEVDSGHDLYASLLNEMKSKDSKKDIEKLSKWLIYVNILSELTKILVHFSKTSENLKIIVLDDNIKNIEAELNMLENWLPNASIDKNNYSSAEKVEEYFKKLNSNNGDIKDEFLKNHFVLIDLDYNGELKGFEYLRILRELKDVYEKPYAIVFSRNEDPESVQKALNMGALIYASKQNIGHLILEIFKILPILESVSKIDKSENSIGDNWNLLYQLPLSKILGLMTGRVDKYDYNEKEGFNDDKLLYNRNYHWIKKLPKAELHNHIGSVLGPQLIPQTALVVLSQKYKTISNSNIEKNTIKEILKFIIPIVTDPFLIEQNEINRKGKRANRFTINNKKKFGSKAWYKLKQTLANDYDNQFYDQSIFTIITDSLNLQGLNKTPEEVLLSPMDNTIEKHFKPISRVSKSDYFRSKYDLRKKGISYDEVMLFFILFLKISRAEKDERETLEEIVKNISSMYDIVEEIKRKDTLKLPRCPELANFVNSLLAITNELKHSIKIDKKDKDILKFLMSAHSSQRCLEYHARGLFNYLRGCEYGGAPHLQCPESIFLVAYHVVNEYCIPDNIRYLDLRCAVDGYNKLKLFNKDDSLAYEKIIECLKDSFNFWQHEALKNDSKVHVNLIITAKRHKSLKEFEQNVRITIDSRNKEKNNSQISEFYFKTALTKVVSFDIAGLEKGFRISRFKDQIKPLLDSCVPITMHAGEEDNHEAIWEAFYIAHAQRLGHALSLEENDELKNIVRESFVNIELCPISNYLTNNKYSFDKQGKIENYPLSNYLKDRLSVSINTDNPYVSDTNLSKEFLFASKVYGGLTEWQILKLILYSFKSITIGKREKTILLKEIDEEIFKIILEDS